MLDKTNQMFQKLPNPNPNPMQLIAAAKRVFYNQTQTHHPFNFTQQIFHSHRCLEERWNSMVQPCRWTHEWIILVHVPSSLAIRCPEIWQQLWYRRERIVVSLFRASSDHHISSPSSLQPRLMLFWQVFLRFPDFVENEKCDSIIAMNIYRWMLCTRERNVPLVGFYTQSRQLVDSIVAPKDHQMQIWETCHEVVELLCLTMVRQ